MMAQLYDVKSCFVLKIFPRPCNRPTSASSSSLKGSENAKLEDGPAAPALFKPDVDGPAAPVGAILNEPDDAGFDLSSPCVELLDSPVPVDCSSAIVFSVLTSSGERFWVTAVPKRPDDVRTEVRRPLQ